MAEITLSAPAKRVLVITGPTASGKSAVALKAAVLLNGEIVSCDSMQIYRGMDVGTAKVTKEEQALVPHHMLDVADPRLPFSAADFTAMARPVIDDILSRGRLPILCGGTGLYIDSVLGANVYAPPVPEGLREKIAALPPEERYRLLTEKDPESAAAIHPHNEKRVIRALEIVLGTGIPKSEWDRRSKEAPRPYRATVAVLLCRNRQTLYERTDARVEQMLAEGLWEEVKALNLPRDSVAAQAIGYKEVYACLDGLMTRDEAVEAIKRNTRNYVKRQETWMKRYTDAEVYYRDETDADTVAADIAARMKTEEL